MKPYSHEEHKRHAFDSFCKKVLKNEAYDYFDEINRQRKREVSITELSEQETDMLLVVDEYPSEKDSFSVLNYDVEIKDELIAEAMAALPKEKRNIILLSYFIGMTDGEIGKKVGHRARFHPVQTDKRLAKAKKVVGGKNEWVNSIPQKTVCFLSP